MGREEIVHESLSSMAGVVQFNSLSCRLYPEKEVLLSI
jgi:hypothetical protein